MYQIRSKKVYGKESGDLAGVVYLLQLIHKPEANAKDAKKEGKASAAADAFL